MSKSQMLATAKVREGFALELRRMAETQGPKVRAVLLQRATMQDEAARQCREAAERM